MGTTTTTSKPHQPRAPKGGIPIEGRFFKGGQFLPLRGWEAIEAERSRGLDLTGFAPIQISIFGFTYQVSQVPTAEPATAAYRLEKRDTGHTYHVIRDGFGIVKCDCADYQFRHDGTGQTCKHGRALIDLGLLEVPAPTPSTLGRRAFYSPRVSVLENATPRHVTYDRPRRFTPTPEEAAEAAQLFADAQAGSLEFSFSV